MLRSASIGAALLVIAGCSAGGGEAPAGSPTSGPLGTGSTGNTGGVPGGPPPSGPGGGAPPDDPGLSNIGGARPNETRCDAIVTRGEKAPLDLYVMFDQSLSMSCDIDPNPGPPTRWDIVTQALQAFVGSPSLTGIGIGIQYFGRAQDGLAASCNVADYEAPDVEIAPLPNNAQPIFDSLGRHAPSSVTPTMVGLAGAINHAVAWKAAHPASKTVVVLVTDGQPNQCGTVAEVANVARVGNDQHGIPTYVIGVISPGVACPVLDPNPPNQPDLDTVAQAGGTQQALMVDASNNGVQSLTAKLDEIRGHAQIPCQYQIPVPPSGVVFDSKLVNVQFTDAAGQPATIYYVDNPSLCDAVNGGWYYDNPAAPTQIHLCPSTCNVATVQIGVTLDIALGCERAVPTR